ncbi:MAG: hypothetical protein KJ879_02490, partial [Nanoarchaeota archaeon]|nr:hypothetical protein [Nanoarchaeota archaeon]
MKKSFAASILSILLIGFASAQFYSGYNNFSPRGGIMDLFDPGTIIYGGIFIIAFSLLFFSLSKIFKDSAGNPSKATAGTISFAISA